MSRNDHYWTTATWPRHYAPIVREILRPSSLFTSSPGSTDRFLALRELRVRAERFATGGVRLPVLLTALEHAQEHGATRDEIVEAVAGGGADAARPVDSNPPTA